MAGQGAARRRLPAAEADRVFARLPAAFGVVRHSRSLRFRGGSKGVRSARRCRQRSLNHWSLTLCSGGPCDRGNLCRRARKGRAAGLRCNVRWRSFGFVRSVMIADSSGLLRLSGSFGFSVDGGSNRAGRVLGRLHKMRSAPGAGAAAKPASPGFSRSGRDGLNRLETCFRRAAQGATGRGDATLMRRPDAFLRRHASPERADAGAAEAFARCASLPVYRNICKRASFA